MREVDHIIIVLSSIFKSEAVIYWAISIISWLHWSARGIIYGIWIKALISAELRRILIFESLLQSSSLVVGYIGAISLPSKVSGFGIFHRVSQRSHSLVVGWIWFHEVNHVKTVSLIFSSVLDPKIVPLTETLSTVIVFNVHFVFERIDFHNFSKVSTLKPWFEN